MNVIQHNAKRMSLFVAILLLVIAGCFQFDYVNQPVTAQPDSSFVVQISATTTNGDGNPYIPYFGILLPVGWTVEDSIGYTCNSLEGTFVYSDSLSIEMGYIYYPPENYYWWVGAGIDSVIYNYDDTYLFNPVIHTDNQTGNFYLSYMLGSSSQEKYGGLGSNISENHLMTVGLPDHIIVTSSANSGLGTLRQAIQDISYNGTITFDLDPFDTLFVDRININKSINIEGPEYSPVILSGNNQVGIFSIENQTTSFANLIITNTHSNESGSAFRCLSSWVKLENISVYNCTSSGGGGGIDCENSSLDLHSVILESNSAGWGGGGLYCYNSNLSCRDLQLINNRSDNNGGAIFLHESTFDCYDLILSGNQAELYGGGIYLEQSSEMTIRNVLSIENDANNGGAIYSTNSTNVIQGGTICNNTVSNNGGAILSHNSDSRVTNTILWDNIPQQIYLSSTSTVNEVHISWSDIEGGLAGIVNSPGCQVYWSEGAIDELPYFSGTVGHPYSLSHLSPLIDLGSPDTSGMNLPENDLSGNVRIWDGDENGEARIDMGAYEFASVPVGMWDMGCWKWDVGFQIFPNPFRGKANIYFNLEEAAMVKVSVFNNLGQEVDVPVEACFSEGEHTVSWNPGELPEGIYLCRLQSGRLYQACKMIINR